jgi:uncharacterized protein
MSLPYRPAWWLSNPHLTTMWAKFFRVPSAVPSRGERWDTPDGDFLDVIRTGGQPGKPMLLLLHGLEGGARSHYAAAMLLEAERRGWQANLLVFRTCGVEMNRARRSYHSGETSDTDFVVRRLLDERPDVPLVLAGVSLGGNVLLKWLGECGDSVPGRVRAAAGVSVPFDLARSCAQMQVGFARVYGWNFLKTLKQKACEKLQQFPDLADRQRVLAARTLWEFDDAFTAIVHGFRDAAEYYARSSSIRYLARIRVPTLLLSSRDDPFHPPEILDDVARIARNNPALHLEFVGRGGHVGFIEGRVPGRASWYAERRVIEFCEEMISAGEAKASMEHLVSIR